MDTILSNAASGMRARMESLEMLANNLANASTGGYKSDHEFYNIYVAAEASQPADDGTGAAAATQPVIEKHWIDYSQGVLHQTSNPLDVALDGSGFFAVNSPGGTLYTRNGSFRVNSNGVLVSADGYPLRTTAGTTVQLTSQNPIEIQPDGTVVQDGQAVGQLAVLDFPDRSAINKQGLNYFLNVNPKLTPQASTAVLHQGHLEESNVSAPELAVRLISVMRQFESLQKAASIATDMNKSAIEEVAKVTA
jgi:flagellar basal-body rod protein FlgF